MKSIKLIITFGLIFLALFSCAKNDVDFRSRWTTGTQRYWIGPEYWSNRLEDWKINNGRLECMNAERPLRTVHLLTRELKTSPGNLTMSMKTGFIQEPAGNNDHAWTGFLIGAGSAELDYRARSLIHVSSGENGGLVAAVTGSGKIIFLDNEDSLKAIPPAKESIQNVAPVTENGAILRLQLMPKVDDFICTLRMYDSTGTILLAESTITGIPTERLTGNIALAANGAKFWFEDWLVSGDKLAIHDERAYGPIYGVQYTLSKNILKMTAQLAPVDTNRLQKAVLQTSPVGKQKWEIVAESDIVIPGWTAHFRVENWDSRTDQDFRVVYPNADENSAPKMYTYDGVFRRDPVNKNEIVVAAFTGNLNTTRAFYIPWNQGPHFDFSGNTIWFPHSELDRHVEMHQPDLLIYTGDNLYEGHPYRSDKSGEFSSYLNYLNKWYLFYWAHGDLTRRIPSVMIPDDHDVFQINFWGESGKKARPLPEDENELPERYRTKPWLFSHEYGGYEMPADWVKMVERTQTSHLPDPFDPQPVEQGIGVYFTDLLYGEISFAILEDRKFKSSPNNVAPDAKMLGGFPLDPDYDTQKADVPEAVLLGERQLDFLRHWAADWQDAQMKATISQTVFANVATKPNDSNKLKNGHGKGDPIPKGSYPENHIPAKDFDSNGWPQTGRNKALAEIRKGFALMIAGDQHLGSVVHHGIDDWEDAGYSFCVPAIANSAPRRWVPHYKGENHIEGTPRYAGRYQDGFGNRITVHAASNPFETGKQPVELFDRATGYGIIRFNKSEQIITMECWPRFSNPDSDDQFPDWPITISMYDNYGRKSAAWLPELKFKGMEQPVVQIVDDSTDEIVYTVRATPKSFRPKVFKQGKYTIVAGEPEKDEMKRFSGISAVKSTDDRSIEIIFE